MTSMLSMNLFIVLPALIALTAILMTWFLYTLRDGRRDVRKVKTSLFHCSSCGRVYTDPRTLPLMKCPGCLRTNEAIRR